MSKIYDQIKNYQGSNNLIISVSAASNVTSQVTDLEELNKVISKLFIYLKIFYR